jgi:phytoene dehydrogenase-like protein
MRDVVVIGSGHNGLVAACYLARAGLDVEVVERDSVIGGATSTVARFPGYRVDRGSSLHVMFRYSGIAEELALAGCGLRYLDADPWAFAPFPATDGGQQGFAFHTDLDRTCAGIAGVCGQRDADAYRRFAADWGARNERIFAAFCEPPTPARLGRRLWGIGRGSGAGGVELARQFLQPADVLLDAHFGDERLKTALAWLAAQAGQPPHEVGTADLVGWYMVLHRFTPGRPVGGSGALADALARRLRRSGGSLRTGDGVSAITRAAGGRVTGVRTLSGDAIQARAVLAGCHILTTVELLNHPRLTARARASIRVGNGSGMAVRLGATAPPRYPSAGQVGAAAYQGMQLLAADRAQLRAAHADYTAGRPAREPAVLVHTPSVADPSLAPPGRHSVTLWAQWHPYRLADGDWTDAGKREADRIIATVERYAPGFAAGIEHWHVQTPLDLERELGLRNGNIMHVDMSLDAMFAFRPLPELAGYRTPIPGLYLTGASTHPGGGVFGASGRSAARVLLHDRHRKRH